MQTQKFTIPGFLTGCFVIESLLLSSLQCFYDEQCFNNVTYYVNPTLSLNATALNASASTTFTPNSTVKEMIDQLMVEIERGFEPVNVIFRRRRIPIEDGAGGRRGDARTPEVTEKRHPATRDIRADELPRVEAGAQ